MGPNPVDWACMVSVFSCVWLFVTPWTCSLPGTCPWDSPGKNTGVGCHALLQGIFLSQGLNLRLLSLLHCRWILHRWAIREAQYSLVELKGGLACCDSWGRKELDTSERLNWTEIRISSWFIPTEPIEYIKCIQMSKIIFSLAIWVMSICHFFLWFHYRKDFGTQKQMSKTITFLKSVLYGKLIW